VVASPTFLTGLLRCGECGARMTLATGKGGRYRYYKCGTRIRQGTGCSARSIRADKLDAAIRRALCDRVCTEHRVTRILEALRTRVAKGRLGSGEELRRLRAELDQNQLASQRLFEAVEKGALPVDGVLAKRSRELQARRQALLLEVAALERETQLPTDLLAPGKVRAFCTALRTQMLDPRSDLAKRYLHLLVEEIRVEGDTVVMRGSHAALAHGVSAKKLDAAAEVPRFGPGWLPGWDSNCHGRFGPWCVRCASSAGSLTWGISGT
jgi:site-specific DNA recombinase